MRNDTLMFFSNPTLHRALCIPTAPAVCLLVLRETSGLTHRGDTVRPLELVVGAPERRRPEPLVQGGVAERGAVHLLGERGAQKGLCGQEVFHFRLDLQSSSRLAHEVV
jgi:hypothetical protein